MQKESFIKYIALVSIFVCAGILYLLSVAGTDKKDAVLYQVNEVLESSSTPLVPESETDDKEETAEVSTTISLICIHVCGEVMKPGVYDIEEGSRVWDVIKIAGGITENAAPDYVNLAQVLSDGEKLVIPSVNEVDGLPEPETAKSQISGTANSLVNINTASLEELMTLSGIGESKAKSIISYRDTKGPFEKTEDIMNISGIKEAAFEKIKNDIEVK